MVRTIPFGRVGGPLLKTVGLSAIFLVIAAVTTINYDRTAIVHISPPESSILLQQHAKDDSSSSSSFLGYTTTSVPFAKQQQVPKLIVGGAQKGGTTALFKILQQEKQFLEPNNGRNELHYFGKIMYERNWTLQGLNQEEWDYFEQNPEQGLTENVLKALRKDYASCWNLESVVVNDQEEDPAGGQVVISFEKTPYYMIQPGLPGLLRQVTPWVKVFFILREPAERAYSSWKMKNSGGTAKQTFEHYLNLEINDLREQGLSNAPTLEEFSKPDYVVDLSAFELPYNIDQRRAMRGKLIMTPEERIDEMSKKHLYRGMYAQLLADWMDYFELEKNLMVVSYEQFSLDQLGVINKLQRFVGAKITNISTQVLERNYHGGHIASSFNTTTKQYLHLFFQPYNKELAKLLGGEEWYDYSAGY